DRVSIILVRLPRRLIAARDRLWAGIRTMKARVCRAFVWALILLTPIIGAAPAQLFQWKNVNIQGMGYVTGLIATARADGSSDVYIRTDVGGAYFYERAQPSLRSAQVAGSRAGGIRPSGVTAQAGD